MLKITVKNLHFDVMKYWVGSDGNKYRMQIKPRLEHLNGNKDHHFSITCETYRAVKGIWRWQSGGADHTEIIKRMPDMQRFVRWHLFSISDGAMHYIANAKYHAGFSSYSDGDLNVLKDHIVFGSAASDADCLPNSDINKLDHDLRNVMAAVKLVKAYAAKPTDALIAAFPDYETNHADYNKLSEIFETILKDRFASMMEAFEKDMMALFAGAGHVSKSLLDQV